MIGTKAGRQSPFQRERRRVPNGKVIALRANCQRLG